MCVVPYFMSRLDRKKKQNKEKDCLKIGEGWIIEYEIIQQRKQQTQTSHKYVSII